MDKSIVVIAPHGDDEVLGACGAILHHIRSGDAVHVCFIKAHFDSRTKIQHDTTYKVKEQLGYHTINHYNIAASDICVTDKFICVIDNIVTTLTPDTLYCPWYGDMHQDHRVISLSCSSATRIGKTFFTKNIFCYEIPSSTDQGFLRNEMPFTPNYYINITESDIKLKVDMAKMYTGEYSNMRSDDAIYELAKRRGRECNQQFAEAFHCMRFIIE